MARKIELSPQDALNEELVSQVHPPDWVDPTPAKRYNMVVIGAGSAGLVSAAGAAGLGARVALIERHLMGGDCLNVGCVPSKALIRSARAVADLREAKEFGLQLSGEVHVDFAAVMERMRRLRTQISSHDSASRFRDLGVDVFLGDGRFTGPHSVEVNGKTLRFKRAVIATGGRAFLPPIEGLEQAAPLTNETVFSLSERPRRMAVLGAGPLGCEMAQTFQRLGTEVTIVEMSPQLLPREDREAANFVEESLKSDGVRLLLGHALKKVTLQGEEKILTCESQGKEQKLTVDQILVAVGRVPNVEGLNLESAGVDYDPRQGVTVDDHLRTTNSSIYAAGDVCLKHKFTHTADASARIVIQNALFWGRKKVSALHIPWATYTDPEIAHVGLYEEEARNKGMEVDTFQVSLEEVDRAIVEGETAGLVKIHTKKGTDQIVGATIVARHAGEMISEISLAMQGGLGLGTIGNVIHPYPTQAEAIRRAADAYNRTRLTPGLKKFFTRLLAWRR